MFVIETGAFALWVGHRKNVYWFSQEADMKTAKEEIKEMLEKLPDNASFEDIQYHIYVHEKIEHGLNEVREGRVMPQEEAEKRMAKWLGQ